MPDETASRKADITAEMLSAYGTMLTWLFLATVGIIFLISVPTAIAYIRDSRPYIGVYVALSGALGGFISSLSRLYALREMPALLLHPNFKLIQNKYVAMYALVPPLIGIVAAVVVYLAVAAELIQGDLFAKFACSESKVVCDSGLSGLLHYGPQFVQDYAKVLVWGFISGFSERFFPDAIEGLANQK